MLFDQPHGTATRQNRTTEAMCSVFSLYPSGYFPASGNYILWITPNEYWTVVAIAALPDAPRLQLPARGRTDKFPDQRSDLIWRRIQCESLRCRPFTSSEPREIPPCRSSSGHRPQPLFPVDRFRSWHAHRLFRRSVMCPRNRLVFRRPSLEWFCSH